MIGQAGESVVNHFFNNFWIVLLIKAAVVLLFFLVVPLVVGYMEHKVLAHMQARLGPMYAGRFHGWAQLIADGVKFVQKEDVVPTAADRWVFSLAPAVVMVPYIVTVVVIPFSNTIYAENLDIGIFFVMAMSSVSVIGVLMAGWSSANKFSLIGALRAAAQLIAYELPLVLAAAAIVMQAGTLSMIGITEAQHRYWFALTQPIGFLIFLMASLAELTRPPFDMPIADSEIIFGAYTEYTGLKFAFFLLAEYGGIVVLSAVASVLYLGGYRGFLIPLPEPLWMAGKIFALSFFVIWLRATFPRLREDQLQQFSWLVLIPLALLNVMVVAIVKVAVRWGKGLVAIDADRTKLPKAPVGGIGLGLIKGLGVTLKHMLRPAVTQQYPDVKPNLPPRSRGVIALKQANCTVCYKCSRECPDWCIYIDAHKETHDPASGGRARSVKVLDRFAIDYALCMYCGICVEVCPFDALFWSPEFEYAEYSIVELIHEKEKLEEWTYTVLPPPPLEDGAEPPAEATEVGAPAAGPLAAPAAAPALAAPVAAPAAAAVAAPTPTPPAPSTAPAPAEAAAAGGGVATPVAEPRAPAPQEHKEVTLDQETFDGVLAELLGKGTDRRVAEGQARRAAMIAARKKAGQG